MTTPPMYPPLLVPRPRTWLSGQRWASLRLTVAERRSVLAIGDLLLLNLSLLVAVIIWEDFTPTPEMFLARAKWWITLSVLWLLVGTVLDVYNLVNAASARGILAHAGLAVLLTALIYLAIPWLTPPIVKRLYMVGLTAFSLLSVVGWRAACARALVQPAFRRRVLILGAGEAARTLITVMRHAGDRGADDASVLYGTGYQIVGIISNQPGLPVEASDELIVGGDVRQLVRLAREFRADEIVVAVDSHTLHSEAREALLDCRELGLDVVDMETIYEQITSRLPVDYARCDLHLVLTGADSVLYRLYTAAKRLFDLVVASIGLIVLAQISLLVAAANAIWSPGPLFYRQERIGKGGRPFAILKFRSMIPQAEQKTGVVWSSDGDKRITPVGVWLRKSRIDELPQVLNVLRGEMSLVGPRPERPQLAGQLAHALPLYRARHAVKPGLTGWAQVNYRYGNSVEDSRVKLEYDLYYVKHASLYLDMLIMLRTVRVVLGLKGH